jgi:hypothetical protein
MWYRTFAAAMTAALFVIVAPVRGAIVTFEMNIEFSGATPPAGATPWIRATFDDGGGAGSVTLKMESVNLVSTEFVRFWLFNLDPGLNPTNLVFSAPVKTGTFDDPTISLGVDAFQADGDGKYDIEFQFSNAPPSTRFGVGDAVEYTITGIPTLTANSFNFLSAPAGGSGPFPTAAHVQGIGSSGQFSGWVTQIPEPASLSLLALAGIAAMHRRAA